MKTLFMSQKNNLQVVLILTFIFITDLLTPLGSIGISALYVCCFLILNHESTNRIKIFTVIIIFLIILRVALSLPQDMNITDYLNRSFSIIATLTISFFAIKRKRLFEKRLNEKDRYYKSMEDMLFMTSHNLRQPVSQILGLTNLLDTHKNSPEELIKITDYLKQSATSLNDFTGELTTFIHNNKLNEKK